MELKGKNKIAFICKNYEEKECPSFNTCLYQECKKFKPELRFKALFEALYGEVFETQIRTRWKEAWGEYKSDNPQQSFEKEIEKTINKEPLEFIEQWRIYFREFVNQYLLTNKGYDILEDKSMMRAMIDELADQLAIFLGDDW